MIQIADHLAKPYSLRFFFPFGVVEESSFRRFDCGGSSGAADVADVSFRRLPGDGSAVEFAGVSFRRLADDGSAVEAADASFRRLAGDGSAVGAVFEDLAADGVRRCFRI